MSENPNSAATLREARRRKILENSAKRLKLIEGLNSSSLNNSTENTFPDTKPEPELRKTLNTASPKPEFNPNLSEILNSKELNEISDFLLRNTEKEKINDFEVEEEEEEEVMVEPTDSETNVRNTFLNSFIQKRLHYVFLALTVNIMYFLNAGCLFYESVFCPFYTLQIIELMSRREEKQVFPPAMYLLFVGLPKGSQKFIKIVLAMLSDLCLYLFTFIIGAKIINSQQ